MSATGEDDHFFSPQKFSSSDYLFFYDSGDNTVVDLIYPKPYIANTLEDNMID